MTTLDKDIQQGRNSLSADRLDMSFGELMSMYTGNELIIDPEFQRLFRWDSYQKTRFIESILLGIPIPSIFVAEDSDGKWEIVDGLQRLSTVFSFFGILKNSQDKNLWKLESAEIVKSLDGLTFETLPIKYQLNIKRSVCRVEVIKWDSNYDMRYELFNRLNTGGSPLTEQEIRNCIFRGISPDFTNLIKQLAESDDFIEIIQPTEKQKDELYLDELVLRFFSLFNNHEKITKNLSEHMTEYMRAATNNSITYSPNIDIFKRTVSLIKNLGRSTLTGKNGALSTSLYDGIINGIAKNIDYYESQPYSIAEAKIQELKNNDDFKKASGASANYKERVKKRISIGIDTFSNYEQSTKQP